MIKKEKYKNLEKIIKGYGKVAVAFSGGVDSTFLVKACSEILGKENVIAITINSSFIPQDEKEEAIIEAEKLGIEHIVIQMDVLSVEEIRQNPKNRCYICKTLVFKEIIKTAKEKGIEVVIDGTNVDDLGDYRPGLQALAELGVASPLKEANFTKNDVREYSREFGLPTWDKPSLACLASRIPYDKEITEEKLRTVEEGEKYLRAIGFTQLRVRHHDEVARIEISPLEMEKFFDVNLMKQVDEYFKKLGFKYVSLDLLGYRTGSLN